MPLFIKTSLGERLTVIAVDSGVPGVQDSGKKTIFIVLIFQNNCLNPAVTYAAAENQG